jgi:hypothetical protein
MVKRAWFHPPGEIADLEDAIDSSKSCGRRLTASFTPPR